MKHALLFILGLLLSANVYAQNKSINYKALIKDNLGNIVANQTVTIQLSILADATSVYQETHTPTTDANGIIILNIGTGTTSDVFDDINWNNYNHNLNVQVDIGSGLVDLGTTAFKTVPYAKFAENSISEINNLRDARTGGRSVYLGFESGSADNGNENKNVSIGYDSLLNNTEGVQNVAVGESAMLTNASGDRNTAIGQSTMRNNITGNLNTAVGEEALYFNVTGSQNVAIGREAGEGILGSGNVVIGYRAGISETGSNKLYIENSASTSPLIWGDFTDGSEKIQINGELEVTLKTTVPEIQITTGAIDGHVLISDASGNASWQPNSVSSGLEALDEGNGTGWRLKGKSPNHYGDIGEYAVDFVHNLSNSTTAGATGFASLAHGFNTTASGNSSFASGSTTTASGLFAVAIGNSTLASNPSDFAMGSSSTASGGSSTAMGQNTLASGFGSTAIGVNTQALGSRSFASGQNTKTDTYIGSAFGRNNIGGGASTNWINTDPLFEIGIGANSTSRDNALTVLKNGKVGIGNHQPTGYLEVKAANSTGQPNINLIHEGTSGSRINFSNTDTTNGNVWTLYGDTNDTDANSIFNIFHTNAGNIIQVSGDGEVGVNGTPDTEFHVYHETSSSSAGIKLQNSDTNANWWRMYTANSTGGLLLYSKNQGTTSVGNFNNVTGVYSATSDRRLKKDFKPLPFTWDNFMNLQTYSYLYKSQTDNQRSLGLIAQDVEHIYPELVTYNTKDDVYHLNYSGFGVIAVKAIQKLKDEVDVLKTENSVLKQKLNKLEQLEARLAALETASRADKLILTDKK